MKPLCMKIEGILKHFSVASSFSSLNIEANVDAPSCADFTCFVSFVVQIF